MPTDWKAIISEGEAQGRDYYARQKTVMSGFGALHHAAVAPGALDTKQKELIALAIGITKRCMDCIAFHTRAAIKAGATRAEVEEMVAVAILMDGGPASAYGNKALEAYDVLSA